MLAYLDLKDKRQPHRRCPEKFDAVLRGEKT